MDSFADKMRHHRGLTPTKGYARNNKDGTWELIKITFKH